MARFCALLAIIVCYVYADNKLWLDSTQKHTSTPAHPLAYPLLQGVNSVLVSLKSDNFVILEQDKKPSFAPIAPKVPPKKNLEHIIPDIKKLPQKLNPLKQDKKPLFTNKDKLDSSPIAPISNNSHAKPKVLLIMDDLHKLSQIKQIEALKLNITPSIFPKTSFAPNTPNLAKYLTTKGKHFIVHLPLEALNFPQDALNPLNIGISKDSIRAKMLGITADFPELIYLNNHTGSRFTQSKDDMLNLLSVFDEFGLKFIDSVTTGHSVIQALAKEQERLIMQRDVFLDTIQSIEHTKAQLKVLIKKAQKKGYAIAICHPHPSTFSALKAMREELESSIELIAPQDLEAYLLQNATTYYVRAPY